MLRKLPIVEDPNVLVNFATSDDAAVYRLPDGSLLIATLDFFTPVVNDPYDFGVIAAANALSDIYAMNAMPLFALNIIGFPKDDLPLEVLEDILQGGSDALKEAGIFVVGGHSIDDKEPKYGMVVLGRLEDERLLIRNNTGRAGDRLVLTKPLGTGIINTAIKHRAVAEADVQPVIRSMKTLNRDAADLAVQHDVRAMTDVSGYGLLGHLREMLEGGEVTAVLSYGDIPVFDDVPELITRGEVPGGTRRNLAAVQEAVDFGDFGPDEQLLLADAQTSGGMLLSFPPEQAEAFVEAMRRRGHTAAAIIGKLIPLEGKRIRIVQAGV